MGSHIQTIRSQCTRFLLPLPSSPSSLPTRSQWPMPQPQLITNRPHTSRRSSPLSHSPTNTELLMTTARPTSTSLRPRMATVLSPEATGLPFPTAESRPPLTPLTTSTDSSPMSPTREPQSTPQSPRRDTDMPQLTRPQLQLISLLQHTLQLPKNL